MIRPDFKQQWLEALRSGRYEQGQGYLRCGDKFCCLGVAADLIGPDEWLITIRDRERPDLKAWRLATGLLPPDVCESVGLFDFEMDCLANMNDDEKYSFAEIADWIEGNL